MLCQSLRKALKIVTKMLVPHHWTKNCSNLFLKQVKVKTELINTLEL